MRIVTIMRNQFSTELSICTIKIYNQHDLSATRIERNNKFGWHKTYGDHGVLAKQLHPSFVNS